MTILKLCLWLLWPPNTYGWISGTRQDPVSSQLTKANPGLIVLFAIFGLWIMAVLTHVAIVISLLALLLI